MTSSHAGSSAIDLSATGANNAAVPYQQTSPASCHETLGGRHKQHSRRLLLDVVHPVIFLVALSLCHYAFCCSYHKLAQWRNTFVETQRVDSLKHL